jgi:hypothetical protein
MLFNVECYKIIALASYIWKGDLAATANFNVFFLPWQQKPESALKIAPPPPPPPTQKFEIYKYIPQRSLEHQADPAVQGNEREHVK